MKSRRRFAGTVLYPHLCCYRCSICRWYRLGETMGRIANPDKGAIGERRCLTGEWRQHVELWKGNERIVGAVNQDAETSRDTLAPFRVGTGQVAPAAVYPTTTEPESADGAAAYKHAPPREGLRTFAGAPEGHADRRLNP